MPRILSRHPTLHNYARRSSNNAFRNPSTSNHGMATSDSLTSNSASQPWFYFLGTSSSSQPSSQSSSTMSSPTSSLRSSYNSSRRDYSRSSSLPTYSTPQHEDSWGQFVDTAEAEMEIIRHSKILSKRHSVF